MSERTRNYYTSLLYIYVTQTTIYGGYIGCVCVVVSLALFFFFKWVEEYILLCVCIPKDTPPINIKNIDCSGPPYTLNVVVLNFLGGPGEGGGGTMTPPPPPALVWFGFGLVCWFMFLLGHNKMQCLYLEV